MSRGKSGPRANKPMPTTEAERRAKYLAQQRKKLKPHPSLSFSEKELANAVGRNYFCRICGMYHLSEPRRKDLQ